MRLSTFGTLALLAMLGIPPVHAAEQANRDDIYAASKSADIEALRLRMGAHPSVDGTTSVIEAQEALRRYRQATPESKTQARAILDAVLGRLELEANRMKP